MKLFVLISIKETVYNMFAWVREQPDCDLNGLRKT
jgi:hypothetical protein